LRNIDKSL